jgi:hypothetical protein
VISIELSMNTFVVVMNDNGQGLLGLILTHTILVEYGL